MFAITPYMSLNLPTVGLSPSPTWASDLISAIYAVDAHNHNGVGVKLTQAALQITDQLNLQTNALANASRVGLSQLSASLGSNYQGQLYRVGNDLYYNDGAGVTIRITSSGAIDVGSVGGITGLASPASVSYSSVSKTFKFEQDSNYAATILSGNLAIRENAAGVTNTVTLMSPSSLASSYSLTLPGALPSTQSVLQLTTGGVITPSNTISSLSVGTLSVTSSLTSAAATINGALDFSGGSIAAASANKVIDAYTRPTGSSVGVRGVAIASADSGFWSTTSQTSVDVSNQSVTITTSGRPVRITFNGGHLGIDGQGWAAFELYRGSTLISTTTVKANTLCYIPGSSISHIDMPAAGTYTYKLMARTWSPNTCCINQVKIVVYEL